MLTMSYISLQNIRGTRGATLHSQTHLTFASPVTLHKIPSSSTLCSLIRSRHDNLCWDSSKQDRIKWKVSTRNHLCSFITESLFQLVLNDFCSDIQNASLVHSMKHFESINTFIEGITIHGNEKDQGIPDFHVYASSSYGKRSCPRFDGVEVDFGEQQGTYCRVMAILVVKNFVVGKKYF
jgi:hypothetical protein